MTDSPTTTLAPAAPRKKQSVGMRLVWFFAGAGVSYLLISTPLEYLTKHHPGWPGALTSGLSVELKAGANEHHIELP